MSAPAAPPPRRERRERIARRLARLEEPLEVLVEGMLGLESRIDLLARDRRGQAVLVLLAEAGEDLARLGDALAQRAWASARVADWARLAPERRLRPDLGVRVLLLAPRFDPRTLAAAESLEPGRVELAICRFPRAGELPGREAEEAGPFLDGAGAGRAGAALAADEAAPRSRFRTGLPEGEPGPPSPGPTGGEDPPPSGPAPPTRGETFRDTG